MPRVATALVSEVAGRHRAIDRRDRVTCAEHDAASGSGVEAADDEAVASWRATAGLDRISRRIAVVLVVKPCCRHHATSHACFELAFLESRTHLGKSQRAGKLNNPVKRCGCSFIPCTLAPWLNILPRVAEKDIPMKKLFALIFLVLAPLSAQAQVTVPSRWVNDKGSVMSIHTLDPSTGKFAGTYINNAAGFKCQGSEYQLEGSATGNQVNFLVNWKGIFVPDCKTITIWNGRIVSNRITTMWTLYYVGSDWRFHKLTGQDVFTKR